MPRLSVAHLLTCLLDPSEPPTWLLAIIGPIALGLFFWLSTLPQHPTKAEATQAERQAAWRGRVVRKYLWKGYQQNLVLAFSSTDSLDLGEQFYYLPADTLFYATHRNSARLNAYVQPGDSLLKRGGELHVHVKRGRTWRTFYFRSPWP